MKLTQKFSQYLLQILPIINYTIYKNELSINIPLNKMIPIFFFLKIIQIHNSKFYLIFVL